VALRGAWTAPHLGGKNFPEAIEKIFDKNNSSTNNHWHMRIILSGMGTTQIPKDIYPEGLRTNRKL
jgi:hypothetical protein